MQVEVEGRVLVITGGTQGVGEKTATLATEAGAEGIVVTGRNPERGNAVAERLTAAGSRTVFVQAELSDADAPERIIGAAIEAFGRVDGLVNAAGATDRAGLEDATPELWEKIFAVNARAPFFLTRLAVADMKRRRAPGAIVNILSMNAHCGTPELTVYSGSKGALATITKNNAHALLADRIRVNGIMMGWATTPGEHVTQSEVLGNGPDWAEKVAQRMPLKRLLTDDEVAQLALFLLSDQSGLLTGALIDLEQAVVGGPAPGLGK